MIQLHLRSHVALQSDHKEKGTQVGNSRSIIAPPYLQKSHTDNTLGHKIKAGIDIIYEQDL